MFYSLRAWSYYIPSKRQVVNREVIFFWSNMGTYSAVDEPQLS
jgi:hypothetical protein